jgi:basic amino acid/polyamine antiporter, APA family
VTQPVKRRLGALDGGLLTVGAIIGTGIFLAAGSVARALPHPMLVLAAWALGGVLTAAGAITYAELGTMYPNAGGLYHFLKEAWGRPVAFLYGWTCLLVIMSGGIAAIATGFADSLAALDPRLTQPLVTAGEIAGHRLTITAGQVTASLAIVVLTALNHVGLRVGALTQHALTVIKIAAIGGLGLLGLTAGHAPVWTAPLPFGWTQLISGMGVALVAVLWTFDGWYAMTFTAGELREPERTLPRGMVLGVVVAAALYLLMNLVYLCATPLEAFAGSARPGAAAAEALGGRWAGTLMTSGVAISAFGCLAATILYSSRLYQPIAAEGLFFRFVARIDPRWQTPVWALWLQSGWAVVLVLSGTYETLFTYVTFAGTLFHTAAGLALFRLRVTHPTTPRPYRAWGAPWVPLLFLAGMLLLTVSTFLSSVKESLWGLAVIATGLPVYAWWARRA